MNCCNNLQHSRERRSRRGILDSGASILPVPKGGHDAPREDGRVPAAGVRHDVLEEG
jgi:hypothetical protein